jgi:hypothetical protein
MNALIMLAMLQVKHKTIDGLYAARVVVPTRVKLSPAELDRVKKVERELRLTLERNGVWTISSSGGKQSGTWDILKRVLVLHRPGSLSVRYYISTDLKILTPSTASDRETYFKFVRLGPKK